MDNANAHSAPKMGLGALGEIRFIKKWRWTMEADFPKHGKFGPMFCKLSAKPIMFEEVPNALVPGEKPTDTKQVVFTIFDVSNQETTALFNVFASIYKLAEHKDSAIQPATEDDFGTAIAKLYDGCGNFLEEWKMEGAVITQLNFGELDCSSSEVVDIEVTMTYKKVSYFNHCAKKEEETQAK